MKFHYHRFPSTVTKHVDMPIIPIGIPEHGQYACLVDSGSDYSFLPIAIGEYLGLDIKKGKSIDIGGITGHKMIAYFHNIKFTIGGWEHEGEIDFSYELGTDFGIWGRDILFEKYKVIFDQHKKIVELKDYNDA